MATLAFTLINTCVGNGHIGVDLSINAGAAQHFHYTVDDLRASLASMPAEDQAAAALAVLKVHFAGFTRAQIASAFTAGGGTVSITI